MNVIPTVVPPVANAENKTADASTIKSKKSAVSLPSVSGKIHVKKHKTSKVAKKNSSDCIIC